MSPARAGRSTRCPITHREIEIDRIEISNQVQVDQVQVTTYEIDLDRHDLDGGRPGGCCSCATAPGGRQAAAGASVGRCGAWHRSAAQRRALGRRPAASGSLWALARAGSAGGLTRGVGGDDRCANARTRDTLAIFFMCTQAQLAQPAQLTALVCAISIGCSVALCGRQRNGTATSSQVAATTNHTSLPPDTSLPGNSQPVSRACAYRPPPHITVSLGGGSGSGSMCSTTPGGSHHRRTDLPEMVVALAFSGSPLGE